MTRNLNIALGLSAMVVAIVGASVTSVVAGGQGTPGQSTARPGPAPRAADGHPDLSGVWWIGREVPLRPLGPEGSVLPQRPEAAPRPRFSDFYQPWAKAKAATLGDKDDPALKCIPVAFGTMNNSLTGLGFVGQIVHTPKFVIMLTETYHSYRVIPTNGRKHSDDVVPSFRGDAVGRWDGDTFVVDITNYNDEAWMHAEGVVSFHSDALHIVERYRRIDANTLDVDALIEDPKVLSGPWKVPTQRLTIAPFEQVLEVPCTGTETKSLMEGAAKKP